MKKRALVFLAAGIGAAIWCAAVGHALAGDTGTYRIVSYRVALTPRSDGTVAIDYYQRWLVTGGHIPWITVGTPNGNFAIAESGGAVTVAESASGGGWSGVRLDLDRDYRQGESFEISFSIVQRGLFYADEKSYQLDFTPGWYDRASTDTLRVAVKFFASLETVSASPAPSLVEGDEMIWNAYGLDPGERFSLRISFPRELVPAGMDKQNLKGAPGGGAAAKGIIVFIVVVIVVFIMILAILSARAGYSGGRIFYGGIPGGRAGGGRSGSRRSGSGGGGFGGASMSCACACVSCACACACAGGGGAGCARKLEHTCPACGGRKAS